MDFLNRVSAVSFGSPTFVLFLFSVPCDAKFFIWGGKGVQTFSSLPLCYLLLFAGHKIDQRCNVATLMAMARPTNVERAMYRCAR